MAKIDLSYRQEYTVFPTKLLNSGLSLQAIGLYAYLSAVDFADVPLVLMAKVHNITLAEVSGMLTELTDKGFMQYDAGDHLTETTFTLTQGNGMTIKAKRVVPKKSDEAKQRRQEMVAVILAEIKDELLAEKYAQLFESRKWKTKQPSTLALSVKKGMAYAPAFQMECIDTCLQGEYQGLYFPDTPEKYKKWLQNNQQNGQPETNKTNYPTF